MLSDTEAEELLSFLKLETRADVKGQATGYILGLTGNQDGCRYLRSKPDFLKALVTLTSDLSIAIVKDSFHALINLSADESLHTLLLKETQILPKLIPKLLDPEYVFSDRICSILSNLSRNEDSSRAVFTALQEQNVTLGALVEIFCTPGFNKSASLHYLGPLLSNLTQLPETRHFILDKDRGFYPSHSLRSRARGEEEWWERFETAHSIMVRLHPHHEWLLSDAVDILPFLLLPLAGPEELSEEENEGLPVDLQYLPEDKKREEDPDIRKMLLEALMLVREAPIFISLHSDYFLLFSLSQLTATKAGREIMKSKNVYPIMREFHKWEKDPEVISACEKLVQVLIGDEPERGMENLMEVEIPKDVEEKLKELDAKEQEQIDKEKEELEKKQHASPEGLER
ncbi:hypothetical protein DNTS_003940 [Danionella cerebrum]|uniref:Protein HGH1 homolog n=1 Tax=Danionella cerebrum TaxID=2873325 RepID=A0A553QBS2_9TELE|nr:hypothetical protein DNTS_003940 [Danionella translucida]